jgi:glutamate-5-semialdehyde dehydrogenase
MRRTSICGATESLLIDENIAKEFLPKIYNLLHNLNCEILGDEKARNIVPQIGVATEEDWYKEYLAAKISIKIIKNLESAINHINKYSSHHTDAIITNDTEAASLFLKLIDSANVMHNTSTQFADGYEFGMGAEIGIATGKLHARGPVGLEQLVTYKYYVHGKGQIRPL